MKTHYWTIDPKTGEISKVSPLMRDMGVEIAANTKGEAIAKALALFARQKEMGTPVLWVKNGAYCLAYFNGRDWTVEGGTLSRLNSQGQVESLVISNAEILRDAPGRALLDYYSSEEFQAQNRAK